MGGGGGFIAVAGAAALCRRGPLQLQAKPAQRLRQALQHCTSLAELCSTIYSLLLTFLCLRYPLCYRY